jgi:hypothetical protein
VRRREILQKAGIPISPSKMSGSVVAQRVSFVTRVDHAPFQAGKREPARSTWNVTLFGDAEDERSGGFAPTNVSSHRADQTELFIGGQAAYSRFIGEVLNDTRSALSIRREQHVPFLRAPSGTVMISSTLPDETSAFVDASFGGEGNNKSERDNWTWETINETQWYSRSGAHRLKLTTELRRDGYTISAPENALGSFVFSSLTALASGQPSSFERTLAMPTSTGGQWSGVAAVGDYWRARPSLQVLYGARLEANHFTTSIADNPSVNAAFGSSTAAVPNHVNISPRFGFSWYFGHEPRRPSISINQVARVTSPPTMLLRGGIGEFRALLSPSLLAAASSLSGLSTAAHLKCIGTAAPSPKWSEYLADTAGIPTTCAYGAPASFVDAAPAIRLFDRAYQAPRSWRANLGWSRIISRFALTIDGTYSLNLNQSGTADLNFAARQQFLLQDEGSRPVFVPPTSIVTSTGVPAPVDGRLSRAFSRVVSARSDLRSVSRQVTTTISPREFGHLYYSIAYTLADIHGTSRGFDGTTFGSPWRVETTVGDFDARHQVQASVGMMLPHGVSAGIFGSFISGLPYTPLVSGDVNGDGLANDRAFVFDPAKITDVSLASGMDTLMGSAPTQARQCLLAQLGLPAARNSCRGPWTAFLNARIGIINQFSFTKRRFNLTLNLANPLAGIDQLLHGSARMHGWGGGTIPDLTLLTVRGFDPANQRFEYQVNPRFGGTLAANRLPRAPFRATIDLNFDLGLPIMKQQTIRLLKPGRADHAGKRLSADSMATLLRRQVPDLFDAIILESDSLLLTREQVEALRAMQGQYRARIDSLWSATTRGLANLGDDYDINAAMMKIDGATEQAWVLNRDEVARIGEILSPLQMRLAPWIPELQRAQGKKAVGIRVIMF